MAFEVRRKVCLCANELCIGGVNSRIMHLLNVAYPNTTQSLISLASPHRNRHAYELEIIQDQNVIYPVF